MVQPSYFFKTIGESMLKASWAKNPEEAYVALEFENETKKPFHTPTIHGFKFHTEHSLRYHGFEYVFEKPVPLKNVKTYAENYLTNIQFAAGDKNPLTCSGRTSTHAHWDITRLTYIQALNWAIIYWLVEDMLSEFCGTDRQGNHFCLRMKDALMTQNTLASSIRNCKPWSANAFSEEYRYSSLNLNAWRKFGSMEFRMLQGVNNTEKLMDWLYILENSRKFSLTFENPWDIYKFFIDKTTAEAFPEKVFGEYWPIVFKSLPSVYDVGTNIRSSFMELTPLLLSGGDWKFKKELEEEKKYKDQSAVDTAILDDSISTNAAGGSWQSLSLNALSADSTTAVFLDTPLFLENQLPQDMYEDYIPLLEDLAVLVNPAILLLEDA